jgi:hypothetical protein
VAPRSQPLACGHCYKSSLETNNGLGAKRLHKKDLGHIKHLAQELTTAIRCTLCVNGYRVPESLAGLLRMAVHTHFDSSATKVQPDRSYASQWVYLWASDRAPYQLVTGAMKNQRLRGFRTTFRKTAFRASLGFSLVWRIPLLIRTLAAILLLLKTSTSTNPVLTTSSGPEESGTSPIGGKATFQCWPLPFPMLFF